MEHQDREVRAALIRLNDALCTWERATGRESVLILREHEFEHRSVSGKPGVPEDITDSQLFYNILGFGQQSVQADGDGVTVDEAALDLLQEKAGLKE